MSSSHVADISPALVQAIPLAAFAGGRPPSFDPLLMLHCLAVSCLFLLSAPVALTLLERSLLVLLPLSFALLPLSLRLILPYPLLSLFSFRCSLIRSGLRLRLRCCLAFCCLVCCRDDRRRCDILLCLS